MNLHPPSDYSGAAERYDAFVLKNYGRSPLTLVKGKGSEVWDDTGKCYLDFTSGIAVTALGHCHPAWVKAVGERAAELVHVSNLFRNLPQGRLAARLVSLAGPGKVFFCNSGAEANEALIKLARLHGLAKTGDEGRCAKIVGARRAFHGRTFGGMSATPQEKVQKGLSPLLPGFAFGDLNDLDGFEKLIDRETAAVFLETIQGEGGVHACTPEFLRGLRRICDERDVLLMLDEVQCGVGRTGRFFAYEHAGIVPDAIGMAKGLGGGFPIGAMWISDRHASLFKPGSHGSTFGGTPLACTAALAVLDVIEREELLSQISENGRRWRGWLEKLAAEYPQQIRSVRGDGYMVGIQLATDPTPYISALRERGLLAPSAGGEVIRMLPPLTVTVEQLARSVDIFRAVLRSRERLD